MQVKIIPKCQRAKNRIREHGEIMLLRRNDGHRVLFDSLNKTYLFADGVKVQWTGWFTTEEASFVRVTP